MIPVLCFLPPHITTRHSNSIDFSENSRAAREPSWNTPSAHQVVAAFTFPKMGRCGEGGFLLLFTELRVGSCPAWLQTPLQILLFLTSASLRPMFRCSQIGGHSEIELKVKAVTGSLGAQSDVITYLDYTSQHLRPHYQGRTQNNDLVVHKTEIKTQPPQSLGSGMLFLERACLLHAHQSPGFWYPESTWLITAFL